MNKTFLALVLTGLLFFPFSKINAQGQPPPEAKLNPQLASCLEQKMGSVVFAQIKTGARKPTDAEKKSGEECFSKYGQDMMNGQADKGKKNLDFSPETDRCLQQKLGADYKTKLQNTKTRAEGESIMGQAKDCFGARDGGQGTEKHLPDNVRTCIKNTVGEAEADKMFKGDKPSEDSSSFKKLESAGCFKGFNRGKPGDDINIPPDKKKCIEEIIGSVQDEPSDAQREEVGKKCFGGGKPGEEGRGDHPNLPKEVEGCLQSAMGENFKTKSPATFSQDERDKANNCFSKNNFQPQGGKPGEQRPQMSEETSNCIARVSGKSTSSRDFDDETKGKIDKECFGGRGGPEGNKAVNPKLSPENKGCENRVVAGITEQLPAGEVEKRVNQQCYQGEHFGEPPTTDNRGSGASMGGSGPSSGGENFQQRERPSGEFQNDNGKYCQENPAVCQEQKP